jgi:hypothetical protein
VRPSRVASRRPEARPREGALSLLGQRRPRT